MDLAPHHPIQEEGWRKGKFLTHIVYLKSQDFPQILVSILLYVKYLQ